LMERLKLDCVGSSANCAQIPGHGRFFSEVPYPRMLLPRGRTGGIAYRGRDVAPPRRRPLERVWALSYWDEGGREPTRAYNTRPRRSFSIKPRTLPRARGIGNRIGAMAMPLC
jgi:hypothetical protein